MESNSKEKSTSSLKISILSKYDEAFHAHSSDIKKINEKITADCEKFLQYYEDSCSQMEALTKSLQQREDELKKKQRKLQKEKTKLQLKSGMRERLSSCKQMVNQSCTSRKLAKGITDELEVLQKRRAELESQLKPEIYESLEREITQLETALQEEDSVDLQEKMKNLKRELIQKDEQLQDLKDQETSFRFSLKGKNDELQDARWELIDGLTMYPNSGGIGIKRMGLIDSTPFFVEKRKQNEAKFESICRYLIEDPDWHPFKTIIVGSDKMEIIDEEDEKMVILKAECNEDQYRAVVTTLIERNGYKKSGRDLMQELWNHKENREASLREGIEYILKKWKIYRQRSRNSSMPFLSNFFNITCMYLVHTTLIIYLSFLVFVQTCGKIRQKVVEFL